MGGGYDPRAAARVVRDEALEENIRRAAMEVIEEQIRLGLDVITDGEVERGAYYMHIMRNIEGIDLENLEKKVMRSGAYSTLVPAVRFETSMLLILFCVLCYISLYLTALSDISFSCRSAVRLKAGPSAYREWRRAANIAGSRAVVKFTVPGPMTLMDGMVKIFITMGQLLH